MAGEQQDESLSARVAALQAAARERAGRAYQPDPTLSQLLALLYDRDAEVAMLRQGIAALTPNGQPEG